MPLAVEVIPDGHVIYKWVPRSKCDDAGVPQPSVFVDKGKGMSANWEKYCSAEECRAMCTRPHNAAVISLSVGRVRAETLLAVDHTPKEWARFPKQGKSHSDVVGTKDPEVQIKLARLAHPEIKPDPIKKK